MIVVVTGVVNVWVVVINSVPSKIRVVIRSPKRMLTYGRNEIFAFFLKNEGVSKYLEFLTCRYEGGFLEKKAP